MIWNSRMYWKFAGVLLILYVLTLGLGVPLGPGIYEVESFSINGSNQFSIKVKSQNLVIDDSKVSAYLKLADNSYFKSNKVDITDNGLSISFPFQSKPSAYAIRMKTSLVLVGEKTGVAVLPNSFIVDFTGLPKGKLSTLKELDVIIPKASFNFPYRNILVESIRNLFYHVPMWFGMIILALISSVYSIKYMLKLDVNDDLKAEALITTAFLLGVIGLVTGSIWAKNTWGTYWTGDVKLNMAAVVVLMYGAYLLLRRAVPDQDKMRRLTSAYSIFCFVAMIPLLFIVPRLQDSLHPGNGGNPGLGAEDLDGNMRIVFYPAVIGWTLIGLWLSNMWYRISKLEYDFLYKIN